MGDPKTGPYSPGRPSRRTLLAGTAAAAAGVVGAAAAAQAATPTAPAARRQRSPLWGFEGVALALMDYQPEMFAQLEGADPRLVELNARLLARAARTLDLPVVLTSVGVGLGINRPTVPAIANELPGVEVIDRTSLNAWEDRAFRAALQGSGRRRLLLTGLFTEICVTFPTVSALADGYEVAVTTDAIAGQTEVAHATALTRMAHAGAVLDTTVAMVLEWFRDLASPASRKLFPVLQWYQGELAKLGGGS